MRKFVPAAGFAAVALAAVLSIAGCSAGGSGGGIGLGGQPVKIEDLDWSVEEGVLDGYRTMLFSYTNNSNVTVTDFKVSFEQASDVTDEQVDEYVATMQEEHDLSDSLMESVRERGVAMHADCFEVVRAGDSVQNKRMGYDPLAYYVDSSEHYALVEPDIATISYVQGDEIRTVNYDFKSEEYTEEDETAPVFDWMDSNLDGMVPKPDVEILKKYDGSDDWFSGRAMEMTADDFDAYVEACKEAGFTNDAISLDGYYTATDGDGNDLTLEHNEYDSCTSINFSLAD